MINRVSTLLNTVLGVKKWFGREGRHGVCRAVDSCCDFQIMTPNAYIFMYAIHEQYSIMIIQNSKKKERKKKTIKKLVKPLKL